MAWERGKALAARVVPQRHPFDAGQRLYVRQVKVRVVDAGQAQFGVGPGVGAQQGRRLEHLVGAAARPVKAANRATRRREAVEGPVHCGPAPRRVERGPERAQASAAGERHSVANRVFKLLSPKQGPKTALLTGFDH